MLICDSLTFSPACSPGVLSLLFLEISYSYNTLRHIIQAYRRPYPDDSSKCPPSIYRPPHPASCSYHIDPPVGGRRLQGPDQLIHSHGGRGRDKGSLSPPPVSPPVDHLSQAPRLPLSAVEKLGSRASCLVRVVDIQGQGWIAIYPPPWCNLTLF